jgi:hypothetical protein
LPAQVATVELFEGLLKFSAVTSAEGRAWLSVAATLFALIDAIQNLTSTTDCTISWAGVVGAFVAGALLSAGMAPQ